MKQGNDYSKRHWVSERVFHTGSLSSRLVFWLLRRKYRKMYDGYTVLFIRGTEKDYPRFLLYTEDESEYKRMNNF